ncbi:hypothetical protein N288_15840 [Bacillus infantis NRRL B-14911]|uniref:Uncharacterized protein n=1 Tax=Bacillus infantis NRRL B-14911 TaxID=1367477 RepID=U5LB29_9BACI|nr:hypothetical protein N288_15840 [Bacillus infantis NRRL B-14911]
MSVLESGRMKQEAAGILKEKPLVMMEVKKL